MSELRIWLCDYEPYESPDGSAPKQAIVFAETEPEARTVLSDFLAGGNVWRVEELLPLPRKIVQLESALTSQT